MSTTIRNIWEKNWPEIRAAFTGGIPSFVRSPRPQKLGSNVPVFCYHLVSSRDFEIDLDFLVRNGYTTIGADGLLDHLTGSRPAPEGSVVLTFDDGTASVYTVAYPLLKKYGLKAVLFIAPRFHSLKAGDGSTRLLTWDELAELQESGRFDVQSHTLEHRYVPRWPELVPLAGLSIEDVSADLSAPLSMREDFAAAKQILERKLKKPIEHMAFPKFFGTEEALRIGQQCGYKTFWWGTLPHRSGNRPGDSPLKVVRLEAQFLRRLPGRNRQSLASVLTGRYLKSAHRLWQKIS
jgi:peptidoglycan/xylan/chitin deacetylase (PgdA/CDA1 family)